MMTTHFYLAAVFKNAWKKDIVLDALGIEKRIDKGVNQDNERNRYNLCCHRIEENSASLPFQLVSGEVLFKEALDSSRIPAVILDESYLDVLHLFLTKAKDKAGKIRLGKTFFPPETVAVQADSFQGIADFYRVGDYDCVKKRVDFFRLAAKFGCGIIELQDAFHFSERQENKPVSLFTDQKNIPADSFFTDAVEEFTPAADGENNIVVSLKQQIKKGSINFSNQPHNLITEVLHEFAYHESNDPKVSGPVFVQIVYTDGSRGKPFPLRCLQRKMKHKKDQQNIPSLHVAMLSMRHLEMDHQVDMAWFRNSEVSRSRSFGDTDNFCYLQTKNQLKETLSEGNLRIYFYQTGLQPAVVGFYRALVEELMERSDKTPFLEVIPCYFDPKGEYIEGTSWY